jgi:hypothetical protein
VERAVTDAEHEHVYEVRGSGLSCWAECSELVEIRPAIQWGPSSYVVCGEKLAGENGPIVGSQNKIKAAIK